MIEESGAIFMPIMIVFGLILMSAFFSGSETGLTSVSQAKIHKLKTEGNRRAAIVSKLREDKERLIGAILLGNNIVNIAASALATALAIRLLGDGGVLIATVFMTVLVLVFAEVMPKTFAVRNAEVVALAVGPIFLLITRLLSPFTMAVQIVVDKVLNLISEDSKDDMSGLDMLRGAVDLYHEEGSVHSEDKHMLSGIIDLGDIDVKEVMVHRSDMNAVNIDSAVEEIVEYMANSPHSRFPVWKGSPDHIVGVLYTKDVFSAMQKLGYQSANLKIEDIIRKPWFIPESITLKNQLNTFKERQEHIALIVDEFGSITGLVTLEDILEEVVGEIDDEHDTGVDKRIRKLKEGAYSVDGDITLRDLNKELGWKLSDEESLTLAGYVLAVAQCIPEEGQEFLIEDKHYKVTKRENNQITRVKIREVEKPRRRRKTETDVVGEQLESAVKSVVNDKDSAANTGIK